MKLKPTNRIKGHPLLFNRRSKLFSCLELGVPSARSSTGVFSVVTVRSTVLAGPGGRRPTAARSSHLSVARHSLRCELCESRRCSMGWAGALLVAVAPRSCGAQVLAEKALQGVSEGRPQAAKSSLSIADLMARNLMASEEEGRSRLTPPEGP